MRGFAVALLLASLGSLPAGAAAAGLEGIPRFSHIVVLVLENESFATTWGSGSVAAYLNGLRSQGVLADHYYGTGHQSLDNYIAMTSGQPVQPATAADCMGLNLYTCVQGQSAMDSGRNLADQLENAGLSWKGYMDGMPSACFHADYSPTAAPDPYQGHSTAPPAFNYADRHDPFLYFADIVGNDSRCRAHVVPYSTLAADLARDSLPAFSFITPDTCNDGHDDPCADGSAGGLARADLWLSQNVPALVTYLQAHNGLLLITFDEAATTDTSGCCTGGPGGGPGAGGRIGLLALSPAVLAGGVVSTPYDHASLLRTIEDSLGIAEHLNNADTATPMADLFTVATQLLVSAPAGVTAGSPFTVNVTARDDAGHTATNYFGTVHFTSSDGAAVLPTDYSFTGNGGDDGVHSFSGAALRTTGGQTVTATDSANATITGGAAITVAPPVNEASNFFTVEPCRVVDTRGAAGPDGAPALAGGGAVREFSLVERCGVPADASAVAANVTVVSPSVQGFLQVYPAGTPTPGTSTLDFRAGAVLANNAMLSLLGSPSGSISVKTNMASGQAQFILDVSGYFQPGPPPLPPPAASGIEHVVLVMMENRSFDHFLGWLPGADGMQAGLFFNDSAGMAHPTHELAPDFQGCPFLDPGHADTDGRVQYDGGACDGWLHNGSDSSAANPAQANDAFAVGYYTQADLAFLGSAAPAWTVGDRYFAGIMAETYPNRFMQHAAATDRLVNTTAISALPTIWDRLAQAGLTGTYYYSDAPFLALWGSKYAAISQPFSQFLAAAAAGILPAVAFVDPRFEDEGSGTSSDDHPHADIRNGEAFLNLIYDAVRTSPNWGSTVLVINFDEWGGFFDHVPPPTAPIPAATAIAGDVDGRLGFRVPLLVISPFAREGFVSHETLDHTSILRLIEWRWGLKPLSVRDATANNLADLLDFQQPPRVAPAFTVPAGPFGGACPVAARTATGAARPSSSRPRAPRGARTTPGTPRSD